MKRMVLFPYTFTLMNWAALVALYRFARGQGDVWMERQPSWPK